MVDPNGMAEVDGIQNLQERMLGHEIVPEVVALFRNTREKVSFRAEFEYNECALR